MEQQVQRPPRTDIRDITYRMDPIITIIGYLGVIIQYLLVICVPFLLLWLVYQGVIKPLIALFRKKD